MSAHHHAILDRRTLLKRSAAALPAVAAVRGMRPGHSLGAPLLTHSNRQSDPREELVAGNSAFAFDVYGALRQHVVGNLIFSPYSLSSALAMTYAGAGGETATQIAAALSFTLPQEALHEVFGTLSADLVDQGTAPAFSSLGAPARSLRIANSIWGEQTYPFSEAFSAQMEASYGAGLKQTDFINAPEEARTDINDWIKEQTEDRIQDIAPEHSITMTTRMVLANAVSFTGAWEKPFEVSETREAAFYLEKSRESIDVPFMHSVGSFPYARANGFQLIEVGFQGSKFSMTIILPDFGRFEFFEYELDARKFSEAASLASYSVVKVSFPKFRFDTSNGVKESLRSLGMVDAFEAPRADFRAMVEGTPPEPLFLGDVLHKAFIGVDELGAEAAAAAVVQGTAGGVATRPPDIYEIRIDHSFIFAIRDTETGSILFLGRVMNPSISSES